MRNSAKSAIIGAAAIAWLLISAINFVSPSVGQANNISHFTSSPHSLYNSTQSLSSSLGSGNTGGSSPSEQGGSGTSGGSTLSNSTSQPTPHPSTTSGSGAGGSGGGNAGGSGTGTGSGTGSGSGQGSSGYMLNLSLPFLGSGSFNLSLVFGQKPSVSGSYPNITTGENATHGTSTNLSTNINGTIPVSVPGGPLASTGGGSGSSSGPGAGTSGTGTGPSTSGSGPGSASSGTGSGAGTSGTGQGSSTPSQSGVGASSGNGGGQAQSTGATSPSQGGGIKIPQINLPLELILLAIAAILAGFAVRTVILKRNKEKKPAQAPKPLEYLPPQQPANTVVKILKRNLGVKLIGRETITGFSGWGGRGMIKPEISPELPLIWDFNSPLKIDSPHGARLKLNDNTIQPVEASVTLTGACNIVNGEASGARDLKFIRAVDYRDDVIKLFRINLLEGSQLPVDTMTAREMQDTIARSLGAGAAAGKLKTIVSLFEKAMYGKKPIERAEYEAYLLSLRDSLPSPKIIICS